MPNPKTVRAEQALLALYGAGGQFLTDYPWEWEEDRWMELVVSLLIEAAHVEPARARSATSALSELGALDATHLATAGQYEKEFLKQAFTQIGLDARAADAFVAQLCHVTANINEKWGGHIQRLLRKHGKLMAQEVAGLLTADGLERRKAVKVATLWLQNVANLPLILTDDPHVQSFCKRFGFSPTDLEAAADRLGINLAVLDDLLALDSQARSRAQFSRQKAKRTKFTRSAASGGK